MKDLKHLLCVFRGEGSSAHLGTHITPSGKVRAVWKKHGQTFERTGVLLKALKMVSGALQSPNCRECH